MSFCINCGTQVEDGVKFCPGCGKAIADEAPIQGQPAANQNDFSSRFTNLNNTADITAQIDPNDIMQNKAMGILAYIGPLCFIPMFAAKESRFARFHAIQGLTLFLAGVAWSIAYFILSFIILAISWRLYFLVAIIGFTSFALLVLAIIGIINAAGGKAKELPIIGKIKLLK